MKDLILSKLPPNHPWRDLLHVYSSVESTNTLAKVLASEGAPHGTILIADRQTGGRGRMGRSFHSPAGVGIYMSVILRPSCVAQQLMHLTCACAVAACDAIENTLGIRPGIKWTNDLVLDSRKIAGILTELGMHGTSVDYAIVGIGINCNQCLTDFPPELRAIAGSLAEVSGAAVDRPQLAAAMIVAFEKMSRGLLTRVPQMMDIYRQDCITIGREISLVQGDELQHGKAVGVDDSGALLVAFPSGHIQPVSSGEVSVRGMYGYL